MKSYIYRKSIEYLRVWKESELRKPLIIRGARQVGKSTLVHKFSEEYKNVIILNLERPKDARVFTELDEISSIVDNLLLTHNITKDELSETLLFIDEIQEVKQAIGQLRYFYEDFPDLHVIAAGSLLEHVLNKVQHFPVGRVQYLYLHPLNFQEFLKAKGKEAVLKRLKDVPISNVVHAVIMDLFHEYALVGGMPEVVFSYANYKDITLLTNIYESIWASYRDDVLKYAKNVTEQRVVHHILTTAPSYIDQRITFNRFGQSEYGSREVGDSFRSLDAAKVIQLIYPTTRTEVPIITDYRKSPRIQFLDTGILNHNLNIQAQLIEVKDLSTSFKGALLPHIITQELLSLDELSRNKPHFWVRQKRTSQAEVDLVFQYQQYLIPIEVKSGAVGKLRSLHQYMEATNHPYAIRIYGGEFSIHPATTPTGKQFYLMNLPYYLGSYINEYLNYFTETYSVGRLPES